MNNLILCVKDYGKIKEAKIKLAPLTLFVGDNNSGKSYLTSLIWGIYNIGAHHLFSHICQLHTESDNKLTKWIDTQIKTAIEKGTHKTNLDDISDSLLNVINECLAKQKNELVKWIFNSTSVTIRELRIEETFTQKIECEFKFENINNRIEMKCGAGRYNCTSNDIDYLGKEFLLKGIIATKLKIPFNNPILSSLSKNANIYIPAARTGFMLTKDIINKVGREKTFNIQSTMENEVEITPFTKPINQFIDEICGLDIEHEIDVQTKYLAQLIEKEMTYGRIEISNLPNKEIRYLPEGLSESKPLRVSSAVVTELSPLILLLKHRPYINSIFYEEPEMGLHPQLQQKLGKIMVEIINSGINIISTTHSDIILQHINNMIKLKKNKECEILCKKLGYTKQDLLDENQVNVYQLKNINSHITLVEELVCSEYGFEIPTFNNALDKIMNENYEIQE